MHLCVSVYVCTCISVCAYMCVDVYVHACACYCSCVCFARAVMRKTFARGRACAF